MQKLVEDATVVQALKQHCLNHSMVEEKLARPHPRVPTCLRATQYLVDVDDSLVEACDQVLKRGAVVDIEPEGDAGAAVVRNIVAGATAAFGKEAQLPAPPLPPQQATAQPGDGGLIGGKRSLEEDTETPEAKAKRIRIEKYMAAEEKKAKDKEVKDAQREKKVEERREERQQMKDQRREEAKTPEGRARIWLSGLQEHVRRCDDEVAHCSSSMCALPKGLKEQYKNTWAQKSKDFKAARVKIEAVLSGKKQVKDFQLTMQAVEQDVQSFKADIQRYRTLERGYSKDMRKKSA